VVTAAATARAVTTNAHNTGVRRERGFCCTAPLGTGAIRGSSGGAAPREGRTLGGACGACGGGRAVVGGCEMRGRGMGGGAGVGGAGNGVCGGGAGNGVCGGGACGGGACGGGAGVSVGGGGAWACGAVPR
jgi:hypothetical protein